MKLGEDPNGQSNNKQTPLHWAAGYLCIAENLISFGARVDIKDDVDFDPLLYALLNGHNKMVKLLLQYGPDINSKDKKGYTSLYAAAFGGHYEVVKTLIQHGADKDCQRNVAKFSPIHCAAQNGHANVVKLLLKANASIDLLDRKGRSPMTIAKQNGHTKVVKLIQKRMADSLGNKGSLKLCVICCNPRNGIFAFQPCGHAKTCEECCMKILANSQGCPFCRGAVTKFQKIFD